jgi:Ser/Thr protein kinase RdoA (MazF antagonist)
LVCALLDSYETSVKPRLAKLRAQVIHNDLNPHNVMLDCETASRVAAIIDFGDALHAPLINELGTALYISSTPTPPTHSGRSRPLSPPTTQRSRCSARSWLYSAT